MSTDALVDHLVVLLLDTASSPTFMSAVQAVAEQLHTSMPPEILIDVLGRPPVGDFMGCGNDATLSGDQRAILGLATLTGVYVIGFVHGGLATTAPLTPPK